MRYVVGFVFSNDLTEVLMLLTNHGPYPGKLNGVGGKIEPGESPDLAMAREFTEETGIPIEDTVRCEFMVKEEYPSGVMLYVYYIVLKQWGGPEVPIKAVDEGHLMWMESNALTDASYGMLAGEGSVAYFVNYAQNLEMSYRYYNKEVQIKE